MKNVHSTEEEGASNSAKTILAGPFSAFAYTDNLVRTCTDEDNAIWFVAADVCRALEISNHRDAVSSLDADEKSSVTAKESYPGKRAGNPTFNVVSEAGLYSLIFRSRKASAKAFKRWVTHEVLPQIRKTGSYQTPLPSAPVVSNDEKALDGIAERSLMVFDDRRAGLIDNQTARVLATLLTQYLHAWEIKLRVRQTAPELPVSDAQFLEIIDKALFAEGLVSPWEGKAPELESLLTSGDAAVAVEVRKLLAYNSALGQVLGRLSRVYPERISRRLLQGYNHWRIQPPTGLTFSLTVGAITEEVL